MKRLLLVLGAACLLAVLRAGAQTPVITSEPPSVTVNNASAAAFSVGASNAATYQWYFQGVNSLPGATNATLSLDDVSTNQAGSYTVVVTSSNNISVTSAPPAVLTIVPGTIIQWTISTYPNGGSSNFLVQLFDHDKPATVENFIHYITSGSYLNVFLDRDATNFVLQGGDYVTTDRTNNARNVNSVSTGTGKFPSQLDNEFGVGPLIHNRFGTLAMNLQSGETNSASSVFSFNLADNSATLDSQDFTVFGRILSGSNVLQYFNTLSAPSNGIYDGYSGVPTLPVNYDGTNAPMDANFFFCDFSFITPPPVVTNPPTVSIIFPAPNASFTNASTVTVTGMASDTGGGLAQVFCVLNTLAGVDEGQIDTNAALGTGNWSLNLGTIEPGIFELTAYAQDGAGNVSAPATEYITNLAVLTIITNVAGELSSNVQYLVPGQQYSVTNEPAAGEQFVNWQVPGMVSLDPVQTFTAETNLTLEVTFSYTNLPPGLAITSPAAGSQAPATNAGLTISGTLPSSVTVTQLTVQLFAQTNAVTTQEPAVIDGTNWSVAVSNLSGGLYTIQVLAEDSAGQQGFVSEEFTALVPAVINSQSSNFTVNVGSAADFFVVASHAATYQWSFQGTSLAGATSATLSLDDVSTNQAGTYSVEVLSTDNISVTRATVVLTVVQGTIIQWTIAQYAGGGGSNFLVELFDHDKPATVENFIHYITSGSYSNMFFDRDATGFVLQGGDYVSADRSSNGLHVNDVSTGTNIFPLQLDNEFGVGPLIHNTFGTLAMALVSGETNSATSAFFFNLVDNSASLDSQDFTVFGRILYGTNSGSNVLQYFNTLSAPSNGIFDYTSNALSLPTLPVNYAGTNAPTDANLFYCDFTFQTGPPVITNPPSVSITFPAPNEIFTNVSNFTFLGTASDSFGGVANVYGEVNVLAGTDEGQSVSNAAVGTSNWSLAYQGFVPGVYEVTAVAQDGMGNLSAPATVYFTNLGILTIITNVGGQLTTNAPLYFVPGEQQFVNEEPGAGEQFVNWQIQGVVSLDPMQTFTPETNLTIEVSYVITNLPPGLAITSPAAGSVVTTSNAGLTISGTLPSSITVTQLTVQLFLQTNAVTAKQPAQINGTNWSLAVSNLAGGLYTIEVVAEDSMGEEGIVSENFTALVPPVIISPPSNLTINAGSTAEFTVGANYAGAYQWYFQGTSILAGATNATLTLEDVSTNQAGSYTVLVTSADNISATNATAVLTVVQGTIIQWTISKYADGSSSNFLVELFDHDKPAAVENFIHYISSGAYSNTFFDTLTNSALIGGDFATVDRTTNYLDVQNLSTGTNIFPSQIAGEFDVGPLIHNTFGTLGAVGSESTGGFFFNLQDNSTKLDGLTVFGRILSGTNILQYFNNLRGPANGIYNYTNSNTNFDLSSLPVNYDGTNKPTDASVFYCDFKFISPTNPPVYTNLPTVSITFPATNEVFTNGYNLTVTGTASDAVGLAEVLCVLTSSTGAYNNQSQILAAQGTTNWSLDFGPIEPGVYQLTAYAQNGAGNVSAPATVYFTNLAILTIVTNTDGILTTNAPLYLVPGQTNVVTAMPGPGQLFYDWSVNGTVSLNPVQTFTSISYNLNLVVTYEPASASSGLTITSPASGAQALAIQYVLTVGGAIASTNLTNLTCQFFLNSNSVSTALPATIVGTNWSLTVTNFATASNYTVVALATNAAGQTSFASSGFSLRNVEILTLKTNGLGTIVNTNPAPYLAPGSYTVKAVPAKGYAFYGWNNGVTTTLNPTNTFQIVSNLTLTATFVPEDTSVTGLSFTYPPANAMLTNGTFSVEGTLPASLSITQLTCQLFLQSNGLTVLPQPVTNNPTAKKWTFPVANLTAGAYRILAVGYDNKGNARLVSENFNLLSRLVVNVQGKGSVPPGLNGKYFQVGKSYNISATPKTGQLFAFWSGGVANSNSAATTFVMSTNTELTANFTNNLFPSVAGTYTGLFLDPASVSPSNAGFIKITVTSTGAFSGDLVFPSITYPISFQFLYNGSGILQGHNAFNTNDFLDLVLSLDLTNGTDSIIGYIADEAPSGLYNWASDLVLYRAVTSLPRSNAPAAGKYVLVVQPENTTNGPVAAGYETVSLASSGALSLVGALPDNTAISQSAKMSKDGVWPVYVVPSSYKEKGMIIGWQTNTLAGACGGQLFWCKPGTGFATNLISSGAVFAAPLAGAPYQMILPGGTSNSLPVSSSRKFVAQPPVVSITLQPSGALSGFVDVGDDKLAFKGAFIGSTNGGAGFIIDKNGQTEGFQIIYGNN